MKAKPSNLTIRVHGPGRGPFAATFSAPIGWPPALLGAHGEIAIRMRTLGTHNAIYALWGQGENIETYRWPEDGTRIGTINFVSELPSNQDAVQFSPHPAVSPDLGLSHEATYTLIEQSPAHQTWRVVNGVLSHYLTVLSHTPIVDHVILRSMKDTLRVMTDRVRNVDQRWAEDHPEHPLVDLTVEELAAGKGPWFGFAALPRWFGVDGNVPFRGVADWPKKMVPRPNPNAGGTDPSFGAVPCLPAEPDELAAYLLAAAAWGHHPMWPSEEGVGLVPLARPPAHPGLTTHKLQPWIESKDGGIGPVDGLHPMDGQHRAMMLPLAAFALTGCPALRAMLNLWLASECFDRRRRLGWQGNGREEGRIAYNVAAALELGLGDRDALLAAMHDRCMTAKNGRRMTDTVVNPLFTADRDVPWEAWTPWEEAQAAWGWWRLFELTQDDLYLEQCVLSAQNVAASLAAHPNGSWSVPYRARFGGDVTKPDSRYKELYGPNSLFAWCGAGLRALVLAHEVEPVVEELLERAKGALRWMDKAQRPHAVDHNMSLRGAFAAQIG